MFAKSLLLSWLSARPRAIPRLWCGYEAYRAQEEGKTIILARGSNNQQIAFALLQVFLAGLTTDWVALSGRSLQLMLDILGRGFDGGWSEWEVTSRPSRVIVS